MAKSKKAKSKKSLIGDIIFYAVLAIIVIFVFVFFITPRFYMNHKTYGNYESENTRPSTSWMLDLDDSLKLNEINIPGTHDSATQFVQYAYFSKCQTKPILKQLQMGYRYLDIRLAVDNKNVVSGESPRLKFMHGFANCKTGNKRTAPLLYLDSVLADCYSFLDENPSETVVFVVKKDHGDESLAEFQAILDTYISANSEKWFTENRIPSLGEVRGKLVLARRYNVNVETGDGESEIFDSTNSGLNLVWAEQGNHEIAPVSFELNEQQNGLKVCVQDRYKYDTKDKWDAFTTSLGNALARGTENLSESEIDSESSATIANRIFADVYISFLSTNGDTKFGHPVKYAIPLNKKLWADELPSSEKYGWVILDYATTELAQKIYMTNF